MVLVISFIVFLRSLSKQHNMQFLSKLTLIFGFILGVLFVKAQPVASQTIAHFIENAKPKDKIEIIVQLSDKIDLWALNDSIKQTSLTQKQRAGLIISRLNQKAQQSQQAFLNEIPAQFNDRNFSVINSFWINNSVHILADKSFVNWVLQAGMVGVVMGAKELKMVWVEPTEMQALTNRDGATAEIGLVAVGARDLWSLGYTGKGTKFLCIDTGVWPDHPAISEQFLANYMPLNKTWFAYDLELPGDKASSHGTHVTGTVLGLERATNDTIGIAVNAHFIATDPVVSNLAFLKNISEFMAAFEFALNPDGDIETTDDMPDVINNSWGFQQSSEMIDVDPCTSPVIGDVLDAVFVAGIANVFSAGNSGPNASTIGQPQNYSPHPLNSFTVGAVNGASSAFPIADFSSRGPTICAEDAGGAFQIKPEVVAPGVSVRSAVNSEGYASFNGTSMASPHVTGVYLLLKEAFPALTAEDILGALYYSATDLGVEGEDDTYGMGMINALSAFNYLAENYTPVTPSEPSNFDPRVWVKPTVNQYLCSNSNDVIKAYFINFSGEPFDAAQQGSLTFKLNSEVLFSVDIEEAISPGDSLLFEVPISEYTHFIEPGINEFSAEFSRISTEPQDDNLINNRFFIRFFGKEFYSLPFLETFEDEGPLPFEKWSIINPDNSKTWELVEADGLENSVQSIYVNLASYTPRQSQRDDLISPEIELPEASKFLSFDKCYQFRNAIRADTLRIFISENCGETFAEIYKKGGEELGNVPGSNANFMPSLPEHWEKQYVDLSGYSGKVLLNFQTENRLGNNLLVDNIAVEEGDIPLSVQPLTKNLKYGLYPNPATSELTLSWKTQGSKPQWVELISSNGSILNQFEVQQAENQLLLNIEQLPPSLYLLRICEADGGCSTLKFIKQ
jgi:subtilisin family serine protease